MAVWMFVQIGVYAALTGVQYYQARQAEKRAIRSGEREAVDAPYITETDPIPVVFGTAWLTGPNVIYRARQRWNVIEDNWLDPDKETWQYEHWYYGLCHGPVDFWRARYGVDRLRQEASVYGDPAIDTFSTGTTEQLLLPESKFIPIAERFGVDAYRWYHTLRVLPGSLTQTATTAHAEPGQLTQRFPGLCYAYARYHRVGGDQVARPPLDAISFRVTRRDNRWLRGPSDPPGKYASATQWYSAKAAIGVDMNPAHIIREVITDPVWGLDLPESAIDDVAFEAAADTLYNESFGLSFIWAQESSAADFIQDVLRHIDGLLFVEPTTGKFTLRVMRDGAGTLHDLTSTDVHLAPPSYTRPSFRDVANKVTVTYSSSDLGRDRSTTIANQALALTFGEIVSTSSYAGVWSDSLAARIAGRDLQRLSTPLARVTIQTTWGAGSSIRPGDRVSFAWSPYGVSSMALRVLSVGFGEIDNSAVTLECIEDVYAVASALFGAPGESLWVPPADTAVAAPRQLAQQLPLAFARYVGVGADGNTIGFYPLLAAARPNDSHIGFDATINNVPVDSGIPLVQTRTLASDLAAQNGISEQTISLASPFAGLAIGERYLAYFEGGAELVQLSWDGANTKVFRGRYDTVPRYLSETVAYATGTRVWLLGRLGVDQVLTRAFATHGVERSANVTWRALTKTSTQTLAAADATPITVNNITAGSGGNRMIRPYSMGYLQTNLTGPGATFSWRRRNRLTQPDAFQSSATMTPEAGTVHRIRIEYNDGGVWTVVDSMSALGYVELAITATSYTYTAKNEEDDVAAAGLPGLTFAKLRAQCYTVRDGYESWQRHFRYRD